MGLHHLSVLLQRTAGLLVWTSAGRSALRSTAMLVTAMLGAIYLDAVLALPPVGRMAVMATCAGLAVLGIVLLVRQFLRHWTNPRSTARRIEKAQGYRDNRLINALDLAERPSTASSSVLVKRVVGQGEATAAELSSATAVDFGPLIRSFLAVAAVLLVAAVCRITMPGLFAAVLPRYLDLNGDHPPYTLVEFEIRVSPDPVVFGKPAEIGVTLGGPERITQADVVLVEGTGREQRAAQRLPMFRTADGQFSLPLQRPEKSQAFYIETPRGRSRVQQMTVQEIPSIEEMFAVLQPPKYTGWRASRQPLDARGFRGLKGTEIEVTVRANLALKEGKIELMPEAEGAEKAVVALTPQADAKLVTGKFPLTFSGRYRLTITSREGVEAREPIEGKLTTFVDRPPQVAIVTPDAEMVVVEGYTVPVVIQATDDVGIARVELQASINGFGPSPVDVVTDLREPTLVRGAAEFALPALGAKAGDVITYFATAWDKSPPEGQFVETATHVLRIISEAEYLEYARSEYQMDEMMEELEGFQKQVDELQRQRDRLQDELETLRKKLKSGEELSKDERQKLEEIEKKLKRYAEAVEKLARQAGTRSEQQPLYDVEEHMLDALDRLSEQLEKQSSLAREAADDLQRLEKDPDDKDLMKELQDSLDALAEQSDGLDDDGAAEREQLHQEMNRLKKVDELIQQGERIERITRRQRDLADRLGEFRNRDRMTNEQQRRADRLAREQERLQQELQDAVQQLEKQAEEVKDEAPKTAEDAKKLAEQIREMEIGDEQGKASGSARKGEGRKAHSAADAAAEKLESLAEKIPDAEGAGEEMEEGGGGGTGNDPGLKLSGGKKGKSLRQMGRARQLPALRGLGGGQPGQQPGNMPGQKPGGEGESGMGSMARAKVMGPHKPLGDNPRPRSSQNGGEGLGKAVDGAVANDGQTPETLTPDSRTGKANSAGNIRGVPAPFRDQAEAYFRRLSEGK
jgi:archaellum component FlaC